MNEPVKPPVGTVRASDTEREETARTITAAVGEGRLSVAEADERLDAAYAARFRHELRDLTTDLPGEERAPARGGGPIARLPGRLRVHAAVALVLSVLLVVRWVASGVPYFWPAGPMFVLVASLLVHARWVARPRRA